MKYLETTIPGVWELIPTIHQDERGYFFESLKISEFNQKISELSIVQENESYSHYGVLRGLHLQQGAYAQAKLLRCVVGKVWDVVVDVRKDSPTFGKHYATELSADNKKQIFIPRGFLHGFLTLSPEAIVHYKVDNVYNKESELTVAYNDPTLGINWLAQGIELDKIIVSQRDLQGISFEDYQRISL